MMGELIKLPIGTSINLPGHFEYPVILEDARPLGNCYECRVRLPDGSLEEVVISEREAEELAGARVMREEGARLAEAGKLRAIIESARIRLAYAYDPQFAVSISGIQTLPHQIEAVYQKMLPQARLRFLLADDPGAGKTIMAGLFIKEMKLREVIERILVLCPAPLTIQWQDEMLRWFGEPFDIIYSAVDQQQLANPWQRSAQIISSMDYAKREGVRERVWSEEWDLVVIDEAHKCSATISKPEGTKRYQLARRLTDSADHVLLLTATPHHGDEGRFSYFLRLLDPDLFPEPHRLGQRAHDIRKQVLRLGEDCPWVSRHLKEELKDLDGNRLFTNRYVNTVEFYLNEDEYSLYKAVTEYINTYIPRQTGRRRTTAALTRIVFQRRLASSARAIHESIKRRLKKQQGLLDELEVLPPKQRARKIALLQGRLEDVEQDDDDLDEETRDELLDEFSVAEDLDHLRREIAALEKLEEQGRRVRDLERDSKLEALRQCLEGAEFAEIKDGRGKLLIFTEHRDTMNYVREKLDKWGYSTCEIHGSMNPRERKRAQDVFRTGVQICVATEAAGEGINLQFCHLMINYDMPWNPTRLEQRMGRIHRIGQKLDVYVFNFVATQSEDGKPVVEGRILQRLLEKLDQMNEALDGRVFDVIGEVLSLNDFNLTETLREAAYNPGKLEDYIDQIRRIDPAKLKEYEAATGIALARSHLDFSKFQLGNIEVEERRLMPKYVENQFVAAAKEIGLRLEKRADGLWRVEHVLADLRSDRLRAVRRLGKPESEYKKVTFEKKDLEKEKHLDAVLVGPGHPLYAAVDERFNEMLGDSVGGAAFYADLFTAVPYMLHFFEITIKGRNTRGEDVTLYSEVVAVKDEDSRFEVLPGEVLLNLAPHPNPPATPKTFNVTPAEDFLKGSYQLSKRDEVLKERERYAEIIREYIENSFDVRIKHAQERAMELAAKATVKPDFKFTAEEADRDVGRLERQRRERMAGLDRLRVARTGPVRHVGTAIVLSPFEDATAQLAGLGDEPDPETRKRSELAAMAAVVERLVEEGFPRDGIKDVSDQNLGFDLRAVRTSEADGGPLEVRRVEVKGRSRGQPVRLTTNEWFKAQQLADTYWLYVVWEPLGEGPEVAAVQDPVAKLDYAKKEIVAARFYEIPAEAIERAINVRGG